MRPPMAVNLLKADCRCLREISKKIAVSNEEREALLNVASHLEAVAMTLEMWGASSGSGAREVKSKEPTDVHA